jgi:Xaa-Pro aminopeptidase
MRYACGFRSVDPVVFLQSGERRLLAVPGMEVGRAQREAVGVEVYSPEALGLRGMSRRRLSEWALRLMRKADVKTVLVSAMLPYGVGRRIEKAGFRVRVSPGPLFPERERKRQEEIRCIRQAQEAAVIAMRAATAAIARSQVRSDGTLVLRGKPVTAEDIKRVIAGVLLQHDCMGQDIIVAGGVHAADPHDTGCGPLRAGEGIVLDIFPQHQKHGYWGDLTRTVVRGPAPERLRRMYNAVRAAQQAALSTIRPGVRTAQVHRAAVEVFERRGFKTGSEQGRGYGFIHGTGHGVGLAIHEAPSLGVGEGRLKEGHVITVEPGLYYPDFGGVRIEDTIVVTRDGWRYLVPCEKRLELD